MLRYAPALIFIATFVVCEWKAHATLNGLITTEIETKFNLFLYFNKKYLYILLFRDLVNGFNNFNNIYNSGGEQSI